MCLLTFYLIINIAIYLIIGDNRQNIYGIVSVYYFDNAIYF